MSLDISLYDSQGNQVFDTNITHNLGKMADAAGIYQPVWRPEEVGITRAGQMIRPLQKGLAKLVADPAKYKAYDSPNGWGLYEHFVPWLIEYLEACQAHPEATVRVDR